MTFSVFCATLAVGQAPALPTVPLEASPKIQAQAPVTGTKAPGNLSIGAIPAPATMPTYQTQTTTPPVTTTSPKAMPMPGTSVPAPVPAPSVPAPASVPCAECEKKEDDKKEEEKKEEEKFFLQKYLEKTCTGKKLADNGWKVYGWTQGSYTWSTTKGSLLPVPFIDRGNQFSLNQNWMHIEKSIDTEKKELQLGFTVEGMYGSTAARLTYARGLFDGQNASGVVYGNDIYQAYADVFMPNVGPSGTTLRLGKFATFLEYEVVQGPLNPFVSRSYLFQYNPFTHTGGLAITPLNDDWTMQNGIVLGNDNFIDPTAKVTYIGALKWAPKDGKSSVQFATSISNPNFDPVENFNYYNVYNLQLTHKFTDKLQYIADASYSHMDVTGTGYTNWYGLVNYFLHDVTDKLQSKLRVDLFNDPQGQRTGTAGLYTGVTYGLTYKPKPWLYLMPEVRYDHNSINQPFEGKQDMLSATMGFILRY